VDSAVATLERALQRVASAPAPNAAP